MSAEHWHETLRRAQQAREAAESATWFTRQADRWVSSAHDLPASDPSARAALRVAALLRECANELTTAKDALWQQEQDAVAARRAAVL